MSKDVLFATNTFCQQNFKLFDHFVSSVTIELWGNFRKDFRNISCLKTSLFVWAGRGCLAKTKLLPFETGSAGHASDIEGTNASYPGTVCSGRARRPHLAVMC